MTASVLAGGVAHTTDSNRSLEPDLHAVVDKELIDTNTTTNKYDLTEKIALCLDRHLIYPLLQFVDEKQLYPSIEVKKLKYELFKETGMIDFIQILTNEIRELDPSFQGSFKDDTECSAMREKVFEQRAKLEEEADPILEILNDKNITSKLKQDKEQNTKFLKSSHNITVDHINSLYKLGQFLYNSGDYKAASQYLGAFKTLSTDADLLVSATWGTYCAEILAGNWDDAIEQLNKVKEMIDERAFADPITQLNQRTWLIHWGLFAYFQANHGREQLCDLYLTPEYINTIQTSCPWILRYLAAAIITSRNRGRNNIQYQRQIRDLIRIIKTENYEYRDPVTDFVSALYVKYDFAEAQRSLTDADDVLKNDFFLVALAEDFMESARHLILEAYCQIHSSVNISSLSKRLNFSSDAGERWIVDLIRDTRMDSKIDLNSGVVLMNHAPSSIYQQVIEKTKALSFRSEVLQQAISRKNQDSNGAGAETEV